MDKNSRRFFLDVDEDGNIILSAPGRTAFEDRRDFPVVHGSSADDEGFFGHVEFAGRLYQIRVKSSPKDAIISAQGEKR